MTTQPDLLMPREMIVAGVELPDKLTELQAIGAIVARMEIVPHCNGTWRLSLCWPQPERKTA